MSAQAKILIVNGDDFGLSEGINRGILSAHQNGILRSTSIMPNGPAFDDAVRIALDTPSLDVGIHLTLFGGPSVAAAGELRGLAGDDGLLPASYSAFTRGLLGRRFTAGDVQTEIRAQIERVLTAGIDPSHLDSHQHVHMLPAIFAIMVDVAREYDVPALRVPLEQREARAGGLLSRLIQALFLPQIGRTRLRQVEAAGLHAADWFWGLGVAGNMNEANLMETLSNLQPGVNEIMCHPGVRDEAVALRHGLDYSWDEELAALQSDAVRQFIAENDIRLASFKDAWN